MRRLAAGRDARGAERRRGLPALFMALVACVACALVAGGCASQSAGQAADVAQSVAVERGDVIDRLLVGGQIAVMRRAKLSFDLPLGQQALLKTVEVQVGQFVEAGQLLATVDTTSLERAIRDAAADVQVAQREVERAATPPKASEVALARVAVTRARTDLRLAERALTKLQQPDLTELQDAVAEAEGALALAQLERRSAERRSDVGKAVRDLEYALAWQQRRQLELAELLQRGKANLEQIAEQRALTEQIRETHEALTLARAQARMILAHADAAIQKASEELARARQALTQAQAGADAIELAKARDAVSQARLAVQQAEEAEARLKAGPDPDRLAKAQENLSERRRLLEEARAALARARLVSPFAGVISGLPAQAGEFISSRTVVAELEDLKTMVALVSLDETEVPRLREGLPVEISLDAFPGEKFRGTLGPLPLQGKLENGVLIFETPVYFAYGDLPLKPGMSVTLAIELGRVEGALRLPAMAIQSDAGGTFVQLAGPPSRRQAVEVGVSDGVYAQIIAGLNEGDRVLLPAAPAEPTSSSDVRTFP